MKLYRPIILVFVCLTAALMFSIACSGASEEGDVVAASQATESGMEISSTSFSSERPRKRIQNKNSCHGKNDSPPLSWSSAPDQVASYALIAENVDHETGNWVHWVIYDIPGSATSMPEGIATTTSVLTDGTTQGTNDKKLIGYYGPCPPVVWYNRQSHQFQQNMFDVHKHFFRLYALDVKLGLSPGLTKDELLKAMKGHILAQSDTHGEFMPPKLLIEKGGGGMFGTAKTPTPVP